MERTDESERQAAGDSVVDPEKDAAERPDVVVRLDHSTVAAMATMPVAVAGIGSMAVPVAGHVLLFKLLSDAALATVP